MNQVLRPGPTNRSVLLCYRTGPSHPQYFPQVTGSRTWPSGCLFQGLFSRFAIAVGHVSEAGGIVQECEVKTADGAVALLGDDDLGFASQGGVVLLVDLFAEDEHDEVGVLLDRAGLTKIGKLGTVVAAAAFRSAA